MEIARYAEGKGRVRWGTRPTPTVLTAALVTLAATTCIPDVDKVGDIASAGTGGSAVLGPCSCSTPAPVALKDGHQCVCPGDIPMACLRYDWHHNVHAEELFDAVGGPDGSVYLVGSYIGSLQLGPLQLPGSDSLELFVAKLALDGTPIWLRRYGGIGTTGSGEPACAGGSGGAGGAGGGPPVATRIDKDKFDAAIALQTDGEQVGAVVIAGFLKGDYTWQPGAAAISSPNRDSFVLWLDEQGCYQTHQSPGNPSHEDKAYAVAVASDGTTFIAGSHSEVTLPACGGMVENKALGSFVVRFSPDHVLDQCVHWDGVGYDQINSMTLDEAGGSLWVGGHYQGHLDLPGPAGLLTYPANGNNDAALLARLDPTSLEVSWATGLSGSAGRQRFWDVAAGDNRLVAVGHSFGAIDGYPELPPTENLLLTSWDTSAGTPALSWLSVYLGDAGVLHKVELDQQGLAHTVGQSARALELPAGTLPAQDALEGLALSFDAEGNLAWGTALTGAQDQTADALVVAPDGSWLVLAGHTDYDFVLTADQSPVSIGESLGGFIAKLSRQPTPDPVPEQCQLSGDG